jgi:hypothetical protein
MKGLWKVWIQNTWEMFVNHLFKELSHIWHKWCVITLIPIYCFSPQKRFTNLTQKLLHWQRKPHEVETFFRSADLLSCLTNVQFPSNSKGYFIHIWKCLLVPILTQHNPVHLILLFLLSLGFQSDLLSSGFPNEVISAFAITPWVSYGILHQCCSHWCNTVIIIRSGL